MPVNGRSMSRRHIVLVIEEWFARAAEAVCAHPIKTLILTLVAVGAAVSQLPKLEVDASTEGLLYEDDPILTTYNEFRNQFGREEKIVVLVQTDNVYDLAFLKRLKSLHGALEEKVPNLREVTSLVNARNTRAGEDDTLVVEDLLERWPQGDADLAALRRQVESNHLFARNLVSRDGKTTAILIETLSFSRKEASVDDVVAQLEQGDGAAGRRAGKKEVLLTEEETMAAITAIRAILRDYDAPGFKTLVTGSPVISVDVKGLMEKDLPKFLMMGILIICLLMVVLFRRITGVVFPVVIVLLSIIATFAVMAATGTKIKMPTQVLPTFLLAVGVANAIHILALFYPSFAESGDKRRAIVEAIRHSGLPLLLCALTNIAGIASFARAHVAPIGELGIFGAVGVLLAMLFTLALLPPLIMLTPMRRRAPRTDRPPRWTRVGSLAMFSHRHPWATIGVSAVLCAGALVLAVNKLEFRHDPLSWLPADMSIHEATRIADHELSGAISVEVVVDTKQDGGIKKRAFLEKLDRVSRELEQVRDGRLFVGKASSVADIVKEINKALHEDRPAFYKIPDSDQLVAQELLLFESSGSDDLTEVVDRNFRIARLTLQVPWLEAAAYEGLVSTIEDRFQKTFGDSVAVDVTGMMPLWGRTEHAAMDSAVIGYLTAIVSILILMVIAAGGLRLGIAAMIPNMVPIVITVGVMAAAGMPMNLFTLLVGTLSLGICVDDSIHYFSGFRRYYLLTGDAAGAIESTLQTTGRAMIATSLALSAGFVVFLLSSMSNLREFGLLTAGTLLLAMVCEFALTTALLTVMHRGSSPMVGGISLDRTAK
jgi:predicted RND superfamily exporter protein